MDMPRGTQLHNSQWDTWAQCTGIFFMPLVASLTTHHGPLTSSYSLINIRIKS